MSYTKAQCDLIASLQYQVKALSRRVEELESDSEYVRLKEYYEKKLADLHASYERQIDDILKQFRKTERALEKAGRQWMEVVEDVGKEKDRELAMKDKEIRDLNEKAAKKAAEKKELLRVTTDLRGKVNDLEDLVKKLRGRLSMDFTNSSTPSSGVRFRKKVQSNREETDNPPGAQDGHQGHCRPKLDPTTEPVFIKAPENILNDPSWYVEKDEDGNPKTMKKTIVSAVLSVKVTEYVTYLYRNRKTKERFHAPLPGSMPTVETEYDDSVKALAFLLNTYMNVSLENTQEFLDYASGFRLRKEGKGLSKGWINGLAREFSQKTEGDRKAAFDELAAAPAIYYDFTNSLENGKYRQVLVVTDKKRALYLAREHKGHKGLKDSPVELNRGIQVHDYDKTFMSYSLYHQLCLVHDSRDLKGAAEIAPEYTWISKMRGLLLRMIKAQEKSDESGISPEQAAEFRKEYDSLLVLAAREYYDNPPAEYAGKGYNLFKKLRDEKEHELRFLDNPMIDCHNNVSERLARRFKTGLRAQGSFREGPESQVHNRSTQYRCDCLSFIETTKMQGGDVWKQVREVFRRPMPKKEKTARAV